MQAEKVHCKGKGPSCSLSDAMWTTFGHVQQSTKIIVPNKSYGCSNHKQLSKNPVFEPHFNWSRLCKQILPNDMNSAQKSWKWLFVHKVHFSGGNFPHQQLSPCFGNRNPHVTQQYNRFKIECVLWHFKGEAVWTHAYLMASEQTPWGF
jgi:hypothetical protein